jgi:hypothetical protein
MDGFDLNGYGAYGTGPPVHQHPYAYLDHTQNAPYRAMASQYVLADHIFPTEFGTSFTAVILAWALLRDVRFLTKLVTKNIAKSRE